MDFKGQLYNERFFQILVILFGLVGFVAGWLQQDFRLTFYFLATGGGVSAVVRARPPAPARALPRRRSELPPISPAGLPARLALVEPSPAHVARG